MTVQQRQRILEEMINPDDDDNPSGGNTFSVVMSNLLLFALIFGLSATVQVKNLRQQLTNKFAIVTGVAMQFLFMPVLGFVAVLILKSHGFTESMGVSLLVVTASPGGSFSNWWCSLFNAELALSVAMTSVSSILSIALLPANLFLYTWLAYTVVRSPNETEVDNILKALDIKSILVTLGVVMGAIVGGLYAGYIYDNPTFHKRANSIGTVCGLLLVLFSAFLGSGGGGGDTNFWSLPWSFYVGTAFPCIVGMALANIISRSFRLSKPECVAISIECCYQNTAIATSVAVTMFDDATERAQAVSVPLFYGVIEAVIIGLYCVWAWKVGWTKAPADEKLCVVISKTYEVEEEDGIEEPDTEKVQDLPLMVKGSKDQQNRRNDRDRIHSEDNTATISVVSSPPSTPEIPVDGTTASRDNRAFHVTLGLVDELSTPQMQSPSRRQSEGGDSASNIANDPYGYGSERSRSGRRSNPSMEVVLHQTQPDV